MNSFKQNPMQMMMNLGKPQFNPMQMMMNMGSQQPMQNSQQTPIDKQRLIEGFSQFDKSSLAQLVEEARMKGIPDDQIEQGLNFLLKMK